MSTVHEASDLIGRYFNLMLYGAPLADEVSAQDNWDYLVTCDPFVNGERVFCRGQGVRVYKTCVRIRHDSYEWIPNEKAISELKALMRSWRKRGWGDFVDSVETRTNEDAEEWESSEESIYKSLGESKTTTTYANVPIEKVRFFKTRPYDPNRGLGHLITESRTNAKITGLSL